MSSLYTRKGSPFIWLKFYNKETGKPDYISTKCPHATKEGWKEARAFQRDFDKGLLLREAEARFHITLDKHLTLTQGLEQFKLDRTHAGDPKALKHKTILAYENAVMHFKEACGDKPVEKYTLKKDYYRFLEYMVENEYSETTTAILLRHLYTLWNYFIKERLATENVIIKTDPETEDPEAIPSKDMQAILDFYEHKDIRQYRLIYYLLLTGCRVSSAMVQLKEKINLDAGVMLITNVKARKKKKTFKFPIYKELKDLLQQIGVDGGGRLFDYIHYEHNYTDGMWWWGQKDIPYLLQEKKIQKAYKLHQLRASFSSYAINILKMDIFRVQKLLDHTDIKITDKHYVDLDIASMKEELDKSTFRAKKKRVSSSVRLQS